jgi:hypothetical protein
MQIYDSYETFEKQMQLVGYILPSLKYSILLESNNNVTDIFLPLLFFYIVRTVLVVYLSVFQCL